MATSLSAVCPPPPDPVSQEALASSVPTDWASISFLSVLRADTCFRLLFRNSKAEP